MQNRNRGAYTVVIAFFLAAGAVLIRPLPVYAAVVIEEALFDPIGIDTGAEWIEIVNTGAESQSISGWQLYPDGAGYFSFPQGFAISPGSRVVVHLRQSGGTSAADLYHAGAGANMGNTSGSAALFSGEPRGKDTIRSFVQWGRAGETWESAADEAGLWQKGAFIDLTAFVEGNSIARISGSSAGSAAWRVSLNPGPGVSAAGSPAAPSPAAPSAPASNQSAAPPTSSSISPLPPPQIAVSAGGDRMALAGSEVAFSGRAKGPKGEALSAVRFIWNFGDGAVAEGAAVVHIYRIPGAYRVGLAASSGEQSASDYFTVTVVPNKVEIADVLSGEEGYVRIANHSDAEIDLGRWMLEDSEGARFTLHAGTRIARSGEAAFMNGATGILKNKGSSAVRLLFPNGSPAFEYRIASSTTIAIAGSAPVSSPSAPQKVSPSVTPPASPARRPNQSEQARFLSGSLKVAVGSSTPLAEAPASASLGAASQSNIFFWLALGASVIGAIGFLAAKIFFMG